MPPAFILQVMEVGGVRTWERGYKMACKFMFSFWEPDMETVFVLGDFMAGRGHVNVDDSI